MTGTTDSRQRPQPRRQARPAAHRQRMATQTDAQLNFTVKAAMRLPPNSTVTWKGTLTVPHAGNYWIYLQALGTNASISLDGKRLGAHRRLPGRRPRRHPAGQPGQRRSHHRRPGQCAPRRRTDRRPARDRDQDQPRHLQRARAGAPQLVHPRAAQGRPRSRHRRREERQGRGRLRVDAPARRSSACPASRTNSSKKSPPSIPTPSSCSTPASPWPCPGSTR